MPSSGPPDTSPAAVVLGGGIAGLAAARLLTRHFPRVLVLERDLRPPLAVAGEAFTAWERPGVPQFRHSHAFLPRLRQVLLAHLPDVLERLRDAGVRELTFSQMTPPGVTFGARADDEDVVLLACRRATFEWALYESVRARPAIELREGVTAVGLTAEARNGAGLEVTGVRLADGGVIPAALVVDTTGRRSHAPRWLTDLGAPSPRERSHETGIFYYTRFYRLCRGRPPRGTTGLVAGDFGWVKIAMFPGDDGTFSITVGAPLREPRLKGLVEPARFERFLTAFRSVAPFRRRGVSEPIAGPDTPVLVMGELKNRVRRFVDQVGQPLAGGFVTLGDAAYHSNPIYGRGAASALVQAALLDEALDRHPRDLRAAARELDRRSEAEVRPFWDAAVAGDRRASGDEMPSALATPRAFLAAMADQAFGWFLDRAVVPAMRVDPVVFRALLRVFCMLEPPDRLARDPAIVLRALPVLARVLAGRGPRPQFPAVAREAALERL